MGLNVGDQIPLITQLSDYNPDKFVRAYVLTPAGVPILGSPFDLEAEGSTGKYVNRTAVMPNQIWVEATYLVFDDDAYTELSETEGGANETFYRNVNPGDVVYAAPVSNIIGVVEDDGCFSGPIEDTIIQGSARTLAIRLAAEVGGAPFDISEATEIEFRMRNSDGSILSLGLDDTVIVVNGGGGQFTVGLSSDVTAALAAAIPAPATIIVAIDSKDTVINLSSQLAVEEVEV